MNDDSNTLPTENIGATSTLGSSMRDAHAGALIGPYRLVRQLGEGGMGVIFHAQQLQPIRRDVALKVIKPGMDSKQVIARFESERQALALMDHPNIARVFDAGTTGAGLPFFVMELVEGVKITSYCDSKRLTLRERIELFIPVCQAIQHAHQKGVIHRDIKPSNILVKQAENRAEPKVIDFGLAKALGQQMSDATMMTNVGTVVGTLQYMSPEQAELGRHDVDTRSDVYSLGVVLYELLTGTTPLEAERLEKATLVQALQHIREVDTKSPSARVRRSGELKDVAALRQCDPARLPKLLDRELDWITMRAIEKDRTRRYETVNGLARDLQRYLQGEPVEAAPPSASYRMGKFVRKHRAWLATAAAFAAVLVAGVVVSAWMAVRASRAEAGTRAVNEFLQNDLLAQASAFNQAGPGARPDPNLTVRTALDRAATRIQGKFANQPLVEASIRHTIGSAYLDLSLYPDAARQFERVLELRRRELGETNEATIAAMGSLAAVCERSGKFKEAEALYLRTVEAERRTMGEEYPNTLKAMNGLAVTYMEEGQFAKAVEIYKHLVPIQQRVLGETDFQTLRSMGNFASAYSFTHQIALSEQLLARTLELKRKALGEDNPETLDTMTNLGDLYSDQGDYAKAEPLYTTALAGYRRVLGEEHVHTFNAMNSLAELYRRRGDSARAEALFNQALNAARHGVGEEHPRATDSIAGLAATYEDQRRYPEADAFFSKAVEVRRRVLGQEHPDTLTTLIALGRVRILRGQFAEAEIPLREALNSYEKTAPDDWQRFNCQGLLGASLAAQKRYAEAEPLMVAGYEGMAQRQSTMTPADRLVLDQSRLRIVRLYQDWGKPEKAEAWKQKVQGKQAGPV